MGTFADAMFGLLLSWVRSVSNWIWNIINNGTGLSTFGRIWIPLALVLILIGVVGDFVVWMIRWRPYEQRRRKAQGNARMEETQKMEPALQAHAALAPEPMRQEAPEAVVYAPPEEITQQETEDIQARADSVSDEALGEYPGMRYSPEPIDLTRKFEPVAEDEQARYAREMQEYEIKQAKYEQELAQWQRQEDEKAQAKYEEDMEAYKTQKARYELELAAWEREHGPVADRKTAGPISEEEAAGMGRHRRRREGSEQA